jgi:hypothetical protein
MIPPIKSLEGNLGIRLFVGLFLFSILNGAEPADTNYLEEKVPKYRLPKLLKSDLKRAETVTEWYEKRRPELQTLLETHIYGKTPTRDLGPFQTRIVDIDPQALNGRATRKQISITIDDKLQLSIDLLVYLPNQAEEQVPCFMGLNFYGNQTVHADPKIRINPRWMAGKSKIGIKNNRATEATRGVYHERWQIERLIKRGYAVATAYCGDIDPDNYQHDFLMAFIRSFTATINPNLIRVNGALLALGHGVSRGSLTTSLNLNRLLMQNRLRSSGILVSVKLPFGQVLRISVLAL